MNKCFIVGNLTRNPEVRTTPNGVSVTTFTVAVQRRFKRDETDYLNIVTWRGLADNCARYLVKGQKVAVCGEIQTRSYDGQDGTKRYVTEIVADDVEFLNRPSGAQQSGGYGQEPAVHAASAPAARIPEEDLFASEMGDVMMDDEDLPF